MVEVQAAKAKVVSELRTAGIIHPHTGHEGLVLGLLGGFEEAVLRAAILSHREDYPALDVAIKALNGDDEDDPEIQDAENNHGQLTAPEPVSAEAIAEQDAHDRETGNVDEAGKTPAEAEFIAEPKAEPVVEPVAEADAEHEHAVAVLENEGGTHVG